MSGSWLTRAADFLDVLRENGMLLESARGPIPNLAELVAGEPIKGSWWSHHSSHAIFEAIDQVSSSSEVIRMRLVKGKVTLVHRRLWPALVRTADRFRAGSLAAVHEEHTSSGAHRTTETPFPDWVPAEVRRSAARLSEEQALSQLPDCLH
jgi:hypothetical protein